MPSKDFIADSMRSEFVKQKTIELIKSKQFSSIKRIHEYIAFNYLFCSYDTVRRAYLLKTVQNCSKTPDLFTRTEKNF